MPSSNGTTVEAPLEDTLPPLFGPVANFSGRDLGNITANEPSAEKNATSAIDSEVGQILVSPSTYGCIPVLLPPLFRTAYTLLSVCQTPLCVCVPDR